MNTKKPTNAQLQGMIRNAIVHIDKTKAYKACFFEDRGLKVEVDETHAVIGRSSFTMCFEKVVANGISRIYLLASRFVDLAKKYDHMVSDKRGGKFSSYWRLWDLVMEAKNDDEIFVMSVFSVWFDLLQSTMFLSPENAHEMFTLNTIYTMNGIIHGVVSKPYEKDMTNKDLFLEIKKDLEDFISDWKAEEYVVVKHETKEEQEEALAQELQIQETEKNNCI